MSLELPKHFCTLKKSSAFREDVEENGKCASSLLALSRNKRETLAYYALTAYSGESEQQGFLRGNRVPEPLRGNEGERLFQWVSPLCPS